MTRHPNRPRRPVHEAVAAAEARFAGRPAPALNDQATADFADPIAWIPEAAAPARRPLGALLADALAREG